MLWFSRSLCQELPNGRRAGKQESVNYPKEAKEPVGQESPRAHIEVLKGRQSLYNPFGILKWARGDSRPTGIGSLPLFGLATRQTVEQRLAAQRRKLQRRQASLFRNSPVNCPRIRTQLIGVHE